MSRNYHRHTQGRSRDGQTELAGIHTAADVVDPHSSVPRLSTPVDSCARGSRGGTAHQARRRALRKRRRGRGDIGLAIEAHAHRLEHVANQANYVWTEAGIVNSRPASARSGAADGDERTTARKSAPEMNARPFREKWSACQRSGVKVTADNTGVHAPAARTSRRPKWSAAQAAAPETGSSPRNRSRLVDYSYWRMTFNFMFLNSIGNFWYWRRMRPSANCESRMSRVLAPFRTTTR